MLLTAFVWWWFGDGWRQQTKLGWQSLQRVADFFSIKLLIKTLFSPFRQISAGRVQGSLGVLWQAWLDRLVSRSIGAAVRTIVIFVGLFSLFFALLWVLLRLLIWPLLPLLPVAFLIFGLTGWA